jgi:thiol:disulfide interchange protein DsbA
MTRGARETIMTERLRRTLLFTFVLFSVALTSIASADPFGMGGTVDQDHDMAAIQIQKPTIPERSPREPDDKRKILYFFGFDCTFCMQNDLYFWQWGLSLPKDVDFEPIPIIPSGDNYITMARGYYAAKAAGPTRIAHFMSGAYSTLQLSQQDPNAFETYKGIAVDAGIDGTAFEKAWNGSTTMNALIAARKRFTHYQPDTTPSLLLNGQYLISPDLTNGDYSLFFQLANGLLSRYLETAGYAPARP